jgi:serine/threonine-protein phosphatase CPPED1
MKAVTKLFLLYFFSGIVTGQNTNLTQSYFFIQVTDPQFGFFESNKGFGKETELYEKAVAAINRLHPAFVVLTGDLVNNRADREQISEFKRITASIDQHIPVYYLPGNHDIGESPVQKDIDMFISEYGYDRFSFKYNKSTFIGLNSCIIKAGTPVLEQQQFDWLRKELSKAKSSEHIVLFCHHPFFINSFDEPDEYFNIPAGIRNKYLSLFKEGKVDAIFSGHLHNNSIAKYGEMQMVTTSAVGKPLGTAPSGIRIVKVFPDRIESIYFGLDEIPKSVGMTEIHSVIQ